MLIHTVDPPQVVLQIAAQNIDGSPKNLLSTATVRVYHIENNAEVEDLSSTNLSHAVGSNIFRHIWEPDGLAEGMYCIEYTLIDLDNVMAIFLEDIAITSKMADPPTVEEIDDKLTAEHGDGSWQRGSPSGFPRILPG